MIPASVPKPFLIWSSTWSEMMEDHFWEQNLQDFTSVRDLLQLLFAEILQFVSQLTDRFSHAIKRGERTEDIVIHVCRFRRSWERLETLEKTEIKAHHLHTSSITCSTVRFVRLLLIFSNSPQSSTFTASASFFSYSLCDIRDTTLAFAIYTKCELPRKSI